MMSKYLLIPLLINLGSFFILPTSIYFILSFITSIYFYTQLNKNFKKNLKIKKIEYLISLILLIIIVFISYDFKYILIPIENFMIIRIIIFNCKRNKKANKYTKCKKNKEKLEVNTKAIENMLKIYSEDLKKEVTKDISIKLTEVETYVNRINGNERYNLEQITNFVDSKIKEGLDIIVKDIQKTLEEKENKKIDDEYIKNVISKQLEDSNIKYNLTNEVIDKIQSGALDPYNTRQIKNKEIKQIFIRTFKEAEKEIDIISPWISKWIFEDIDLMDGFKIALNRGVNIKILYGIGNSNNSQNNHSDKRSIYTEQNAKRLKELFKNYNGTLSLKKVNTHEKMLLCDEKYVLIGSYNLLSFNGDYSGDDIRSECMQYQENKTYIQQLRKENFDF